jgi:AraC-like DNA-binding protein
LQIGAVDGAGGWPVFVISNHDIHLAYNDRDVIIRVFLFDPQFLSDDSNAFYGIETLLPYREFGSHASNLINSKSPHYLSIVELLSRIYDEMHQHQRAYKIMAKSLLIELSINLTRYLESENINLRDYKSYHERLNNYEKIEPACQFIKINFSDKISLCDIAASVNMSSSNFSLVFKKTMGISPVRFLIRERVSKASEMLLMTDSKVIEISESCGFVSLSNFIEMFKKYTGKTPSEYRKLMSE